MDRVELFRTWDEKGVPLIHPPDLYPSSVVRHNTSPGFKTVYSPQRSASHPLVTAVLQPQPRTSFQVRINSRDRLLRGPRDLPRLRRHGLVKAAVIYSAEELPVLEVLVT